MSLQTGNPDEGNEVREVILNTKEMIKSLLKKFHAHTRNKPEKLIYYRDGVSEGQFNDVLNMEVTAIQRACTELQVQI